MKGFYCINSQFYNDDIFYKIFNATCVTKRIGNMIIY